MAFYRTFSHFFESDTNFRFQCFDLFFQSLEGPIAIFEDRHFLPIFGGADDGEVFRADHEIDMAHGLVDAKGMDFLFGVFLIIGIKIAIGR